jgi:hypothetical protein
MNSLTEQDITNILLQRDRKPVARNVMDNYMLPMGGMAGKGILSALGALTNIKRVPQIYEVK